MALQRQAYDGGDPTNIGKVAVVGIVANQIEALGLEAAISSYERAFRIGPVVTSSNEDPLSRLQNVDVAVISASYSGLEYAVQTVSDLRDNNSQMGIVGISQPALDPHGSAESHALQFLEATANGYLPITGGSDNPLRLLLAVQIAAMGGTYSSVHVFGRNRLALLPGQELYTEGRDLDIMSLSGQSELVELMNEKLIGDYTDSNKWTQRQKEVVALILLGMSNQQIADRLNLNPKSVENNINTIISKVGYKSDEGTSSRRYFIAAATLLLQQHHVHVTPPHHLLAENTDVWRSLRQKDVYKI